VQSSLQVDPDNVELQSLKAELDEFISLTEASIAELNPPATRTATSPASQPAPKEKWSKENHPAYQAGYRKPSETPAAEEPHAPASFSVNDHVLARWTSGDNAFYPARITSITGSSSKPVYIVSFKSYGTTETLTSRDIKPMYNSGDSRKRKADGTPGSSSSHITSPPPANTSVISAAADINPALASQARKEPSAVSDGPPRPSKVARKVKANKELEAGKSKWQDFTSKSKFGKTSKKDSMFRTPEGVNARGMYAMEGCLLAALLIRPFYSWFHWIRPGNAQGSVPQPTYL
jgi:survival-of-motor-neuron-related-splicing factor 30